MATPKTEKKSILERMKSMLSKAIEKMNLAEMVTTDGAVLYADAFEPGQVAYLLEGETYVIAPAGEYPLQDGSTIVIGEEGAISEVRQKETAPETVTDEELSAILTEALKPLTEELESIKTKFEKSEKDLKERDTEIISLKAKLKEPASDGVKPKPDGDDKQKFAKQDMPATDMKGRIANILFTAEN